MQQAVAYFGWDVAEVSFTYIRTLNIVGWEDTPQVRSLMPVGLGPISDGHTPNTRSDIINSRISIRVIMT